MHVCTCIHVHIIVETCDGIWQALQATYLKPPKNMDEWKSIAREFENEWNFPHCLGALDGKHIAMDCPKNGGSSYFNYKGFHSLVLMGICDANYHHFQFVIDSQSHCFPQVYCYLVINNMVYHIVYIIDACALVILNNSH